MIGIYKITSPSGKVYVGQSIDVEKRLKRYKGLHCKNQRNLYYSLLKHGYNNHKTEILCECEIHELNEKERYYQILFDCVNNGLNCSIVNDFDNSGFMSEESKKRMSIAQTGKVLSNETRLKMSLSKKGVPKPKRSIDHSKKIALSKLGNKNRLGFKHSEESKLKMSLSAKGKTYSEEKRLKSCKKIINTITGEIHLGVKSVAFILNCKPSGLCHKLNGIYPNNTIYKYL